MAGQSGEERKKLESTYSHPPPPSPYLSPSPFSFKLSSLETSTCLSETLKAAEIMQSAQTFAQEFKITRYHQLAAGRSINVCICMKEDFSPKGLFSIS